MIPGLLEDVDWLRRFGVQAEHLESLILPLEGEKFSVEELKEVYRDIESKVHSIDSFDNDIVQKNLRMYLAHKKLIKDYDLDFTGVKCTFELSDNVCSPCIAQSMLNSEGYVSGCTTEPKGSLMMYIMRILSDGAIFQGDIEQVERDSGIARMLSCGSAPLGFAESREKYSFETAPELEGEAGAICANVTGKPGRITLGRIARVEDEYVMQIAEGDVIDDTNATYYRERIGLPNMPFATIRLFGDPNKFIDNLRSQYMHICYDDHPAEARVRQALSNRRTPALSHGP